MGIHLRGSIWYYKFKVRGHVIRGSTSTSNEQEALEFETKIKKQVLADLEESAKEKSSMKLAGAIDRIQAERFVYNKSPDTPKAHLLAIKDILGDISLDEIDTSSISLIKKHLLGLKKQPATVNRYLAALKTLLITANRDWRTLLTLPPRISLFPEPQGRMKTFSSEEEEAIIHYCLTAQGEAMLDLAWLFPFLCSSGLRLGEAVAITYATHIDLGSQEVTLEAGMTKTSRKRSVPLSELGAAILSDRNTGRPRPFMLRGNSYTKAFSMVKKALGMDKDPDTCLHACRHTFASRLRNKGGDMHIVGKLLGHSSTYMTDRYAHIWTETLKETVKLLD
jgi:integrase